MLFKLDENLSPSWGDPLGTAGHDVVSATEEGLQGARDDEVIEAARREQRCLVTADEHFAQLINYPAERYSGIIVLRHACLGLAGTNDSWSRLRSPSRTNPRSGVCGSWNRAGSVSMSLTK